jgi:hypothetical protein
VLCCVALSWSVLVATSLSVCIPPTHILHFNTFKDRLCLSAVIDRWWNNTLAIFLSYVLGPCGQCHHSDAPLGRRRKNAIMIFLYKAPPPNFFFSIFKNQRLWVASIWPNINCFTFLIKTRALWWPENLSLSLIWGKYYFPWNRSICTSNNQNCYPD